MNTVVAPAHLASAIRKPIRVMVVDDAVVVRRQLTRWIGDEKDMMVAACLRTGREAVDQLETRNPDVVVLDVDMPELDGISALPQLLKKKRDLVVIMASTLTRRNAEISLRALSLGAADYVPKPATNREVTTSARHGLAWYELDMSWILIKAMKFVGLAKAVKVASVDSQLVSEREAA